MVSVPRQPVVEQCPVSHLEEDQVEVAVLLAVAEQQGEEAVGREAVVAVVLVVAVEAVVAVVPVRVEAVVVALEEAEVAAVQAIVAAVLEEEVARM